MATCTGERAITAPISAADAAAVAPPLMVISPPVMTSAVAAPLDAVSR